MIFYLKLFILIIIDYYFQFSNIRIQKISCFNFIFNKSKKLSLFIYEKLNFNIKNNIIHYSFNDSISLNI